MTPQTRLLPLLLGCALSIAPASAQTCRGFAFGEMDRTLLYDASGTLLKSIPGAGFTTVKHLDYGSRFLATDGVATTFYDLYGSQLGRANKTSAAWQSVEVAGALVIVTDGDRVRLFGTDGQQRGQDIMRTGGARQAVVSGSDRTAVIDDDQVRIYDDLGTMVFNIDNNGAVRQEVDKGKDQIAVTDYTGAQIFDRHGNLVYVIPDRAAGKIDVDIGKTRNVAVDDRGVRIYDKTGLLKKAIGPTVGRPTVVRTKDRIIVTDDQGTTIYDLDGNPKGNTVNKKLNTKRQEVTLHEGRIIVIGDQDVTIVDKDGTVRAGIPTSGRADVEKGKSRVIVTDDQDTGIYDSDGFPIGRINKTGATRQKVKVKGERITVIDENEVRIYDLGGQPQGGAIPTQQSYQSYVQPFDPGLAIRDQQAKRLRFYDWSGNQMGPTLSASTVFTDLSYCGNLWAVPQLRSLQLYDNSFVPTGSSVATSGNPIPEPLCFPVMTAHPDLVDVSLGGQQTYRIDAGDANAGKTYLILGSLSGTAPGLPFGGLVIPLNPDSYFQFTAINPNTLIQGSLGFLDDQGQAQAAFTMPPDIGMPLLGAEFDHACLVVDLLGGSVETVSLPVELEAVMSASGRPRGGPREPGTITSLEELDTWV